jgi:hypothetical protein
MPRPFTRQNDGAEAWEDLTAPNVISSPQIIGDHGAIYDAASGAPITGYGYPHSLTMVASTQAAQAKADQEKQGSTGFQILDTAAVPSNTDLPPEQPSSPAAGADPASGGWFPDVNIFSDSTTCPKSECILWAIGGIIIGKVIF